MSPILGNLKTEGAGLAVPSGGKDRKASCARALFALGLSLTFPIRAQQNQQQNPPPDLTHMNLEDLLNVKVTSVSKREENLSRVAAAVFVISQEDIRRSGATNIPDVLRMAPGVDVEQIDANAWAISIRGFNERYSNKVLVLIDGRSVYTPSFSGVFWDQIDMPMDNIERIEVIRGPGATVWGANAVNGVISIITKSAKETKGTLVTAAGGSQVKADGLVQHGGSVGADAAYRVFGNGSDIGNSAGVQMPADDHWRRVHGGGRLDWDVSPADSLMVQGDLFANKENQTRFSGYIPTPFDTIFSENINAVGGDVLARWSHTLAGGSQTSLQAYFDTYRRTDMGVPEVERTFDLDFQDHVAPRGRHNIVWGLGFRTFTSSLSPGYSVSFSPPSERGFLFSGFFQDEIRATDSLWVTVGSKMERNPYTGFQTEPSVRLVWAPPASRHAIWASASKAVRQPSRADTAIETNLETIPAGPDAVEVFRLYGNRKILNEQALDYELGYRSQFAKSLSLDVATFLTFYRHLETIEPQAMQVIPGSPTEFQIPMLYENNAHAADYGGEVSLNWVVNSRWRIVPGYSYLHSTIRQDPSSQGLPAYTVPADFPQNTLQARSLWNLSRKMEFDQSLYYTARLPGATIPGHVRLDLRLARRLSESVDISVVGQNLLRPRTLEYGDSYGVIGTQSVRSVYGKLTWRF